MCSSDKTLPNKRSGLIRCLSISTGIAIAALAAISTSSQAQFGLRGGSMGSRAPMMGGGSHFNGIVARGSRFNSMSNGVVGKQGFKRKGKGQTYLSTSETGNGDTRRPPDRRRPHGKRPPYWGPIGPAIGTGVVIGTLGPAGANPPPPANFSGPPSRRGGITLPPNNEQRFVKDEVVLEFANNVPQAGVAQLLARHGLRQLEAQNFTLTNSTYVRARIVNRRPVRTALLGLGNEAILRTAQADFLYSTSQQAGDGPQAPSAEPGPAATIPAPAPSTPKATPVVAAAGALPSAGDPAQYALAKLHLNEAHALATGDKVVVAVIDSGIDLGHPELQGVVAGSYDALGSSEKPHPHGTAIAGAIAAHARLLGAAPAARILAIRAFGSAGASAQATTFAILKGIDYAAIHHARVINMSFAGPADPGLSRHLAAAKAKGVVLIAASGNFGPKSPRQYPAADPNVIAVSATDANDRMFKASNIGPHIAVAAPGVDILLPAPNSDYQVTSGTSFSAAYVTGVAALVLQRAPGLAPDAVRNILEATAKDLGPRGKDDQFGAGLVDAYQAIMAVQANAAGSLQNTPQPMVAQ
jgi:hypothetical protein